MRLMDIDKAIARINEAIARYEAQIVRLTKEELSTETTSSIQIRLLYISSMRADIHCLNYIAGRNECVCWIPCSERMPEDYEYVLITEDYDGFKGRHCTKMTVAYHALGIWSSQGGMNYKVLAWMPLPKPYGGDNDEANQN